MIAKPRYQQLKDYIIEQIATGQLQPDDRVPSENDLVTSMSVSRMTANRALRELTDEGYVERVAGRGTFVSDYRSRSHLLEVHNIADEIERRGRAYSSQVIRQVRERAGKEVARALDAKPGTEIYHLQLVHNENGAPIQFEDRHVLASFAPDCLQEDFECVTPSAYLTSIAPLQEAEQVVRATRPDANVQRLLQMQDGEPCLVILRRTWSQSRPVTFARLHHPGARYELTGHYKSLGVSSAETADVVQLESLGQ